MLSQKNAHSSLHFSFFPTSTGCPKSLVVRSCESPAKLHKKALKDHFPGGLFIHWNKAYFCISVSLNIFLHNCERFHELRFLNSINGNSLNCLLNVRSLTQPPDSPKQTGRKMTTPHEYRRAFKLITIQSPSELTAPVHAGRGAAEIQTLINLSQNLGRAKRYWEVTVCLAEQQSSLLILLLICLRASECANAAQDQNMHLQTWITSNFGSNSQWSSYTLSL